MRLIILLAFLCSPVYADDLERPVPVSDEPSDEDYQLAYEFGVSKSEMREAKRRVKLTYSAQKTEDSVSYSMQDIDLFAIKVDSSLEKLIKTATGVLRHKKFYQEADKIELEYESQFRNFHVQYVRGDKDLGDHGALSQWLTNLYDKIEDLIGEELCKRFHFYDIKIFNYAVPVVFAPAKYDLKEYKLHYAGYLYVIGKWKHHGLAGVVTYWAVNIACQIGTYGIGAFTFVCGPIANYSEHVMDKKIAPPIAERVWKKANP